MLCPFFPPILPTLVPCHPRAIRKSNSGIDRHAAAGRAIGVVRHGEGHDAPPCTVRVVAINIGSVVLVAQYSGPLSGPEAGQLDRLQGRRSSGPKPADRILAKANRRSTTSKHGPRIRK
jgi:hypothetical protein